MDRKEAKTILAKELGGYRKRLYKELLYLLKTQDVREVNGPSGKTYQLEFQAVWDDCEGGNLRVIGAIDDGGLRAFIPMTDDFIITPD
ncbi:MAG: hypothetical protein WA240_04700 [Nitrospirota bacterium]|jgi:hypothetical protein